MANYIVECEYPIEGDIGCNRKLDEELENLGELQSSGSGFGVRDVQFECQSQEEAERLCKEIDRTFKKLGKEGSSWWIES